MTDARILVRAAGGVVCRPGPGGQVEIAVIHRPSQDDWTLPKGKLEARETAERAAMREVQSFARFGRVCRCFQTRWGRPATCQFCRRD